MTKDIILFVNSVPPSAVESVRQVEKETKQKFRIAVIRNKPNGKSLKPLKNEAIDIELVCDFSNSEAISQELIPHHDEIAAITCRSESNIELFAKVIPNVPYLRTPTSESLQWSSDKVKMRKRFKAHDKSITPNFMVVGDATKKTITEIAKKIGFPLIIKPSGLAASMLVTLCYHEEELESELKKVLKKVKNVYKEYSFTGDPQILVEEFMEGEMYSIDAYVTSRGRVYFCPLVHVTTGHSIGRDDFFGYKRITPTTLRKSSTEKAEEAAKSAIRALGLRSSTAHIELMRTDGGWKVIEVGARVGGFRDDLYRLAYSIEHGANDIMVRLPKTPVISKKAKGHAAAMQFFPEKEGKLVSLTGVKKIQELQSVHNVTVKKKVGEKCLFAKHGGKAVVEVILYNKERSKLLADIRRIEKTLVIKTK